MIPFFYWTFVVILLLLAILFILAFTVRVKINPLMIKVTVFHIPVFIAKGKKLYAKIAKAESKMTSKPAMHPLYFHLLSYLHIDRICITQTLTGRKDIEAILYGICEIIKAYTDEKILTVCIKEGDSNTELYLQVHFYVGVILGNYICIRRQIHAKSHS